jgi:signal transduction histidine kinase
LGLEAGLEWLAERVQDEYGISVECEHDRLAKPLDEEIRIVLFQIVRELLMNVAKHAQAGKVKVTVSRERNQIRLSVEDNGIGFNPSSVGGARGEKTGFGLFSIRERMNYLGGELRIDSAARSGTRVLLRVPLNRKRKRRIKELPHEH